MTPTGLRLCIAAGRVGVVPDGTTLGNEGLVNRDIHRGDIATEDAPFIPERS
jgi:hypothetical protein